MPTITGVGRIIDNPKNRMKEKAMSKLEIFFDDSANHDGMHHFVMSHEDMMEWNGVYRITLESISEKEFEKERFRLKEKIKELPLELQKG